MSGSRFAARPNALQLWQRFPQPALRRACGPCAHGLRGRASRPHSSSASSRPKSGWLSNPPALLIADYCVSCSASWRRMSATAGSSSRLLLGSGGAVDALFVVRNFHSGCLHNVGCSGFMVGMVSETTFGRNLSTVRRAPPSGQRRKGTSYCASQFGQISRIMSCHDPRQFPDGLTIWSRRRGRKVLFVTEPVRASWRIATRPLLRHNRSVPI